MKGYTKNFSVNIDSLWDKLDSYRDVLLAEAEALTLMI